MGRGRSDLSARPPRFGSVTNPLPLTQPVDHPADPKFMVKPASPVAAGSASAARAPATKLNYFSNLQSGFQALLLHALAAQHAPTGPLAGSAKRGTSGAILAGKARLPPKAAAATSRRSGGGEGDLDPLARSLAVPGAIPLSSSATASPVASVVPDVADARVLEDAVRRIAWGGDRRRGVARLELGGSYEGTVVTVQGEGREVTLRLEVPPGTDVNRLPERLVERLTARGLIVTDVAVA